MAVFTLQGVTPETIKNTSTEAPQGGLKPFPCDAQGWTRHTAVIAKAGFKVFDMGYESISLLLENGAHGGECLVSLDPSGAPDPAKAAEGLVRVLKILDAFTPGGQVDTDLIGKKTGQIVSVIAKHKGFREGKNGGWFHKVSLIVTGASEKLTPVDTTVALPLLPGQEAGEPGPF